MANQRFPHDSLDTNGSTTATSGRVANPRFPHDSLDASERPTLDPAILDEIHATKIRMVDATPGAPAVPMRRRAPRVPDPIPRVAAVATTTPAETTYSGVASKPIIGLPILRVIPQDVHTIVDYATSALTGGAAFFATTPEARVASIALGASGASVALTTDYRLSPVKLIPIEAHEAIDYAWSAAAIAAPFVLGYAKKSPVTAIMHVVSGAIMLGVSMLTDYRATKGVGRKVSKR